MLRIDPLLFLFIIELLIVLFALSIYLFKQYMATAGLAEQNRLKREALIETYRQDMKELSGQISNFQNKEGERIEKELLHDYMTTERNFLRSIVEGLEKIETHEGPLCEEVYSRYRGLHKGQFEKLKKATVERNQFEGTINEQRQKVAQLLGYKDMLDELGAQFEKTKNANEKLKNRLQELIPEAEQSEELKAALKTFELNNRDMGMSLSTLEEENQRLSEKLDAQNVKASKIDELVEKQEKLVRDNAKFERRAEVAEKELEKLKFQFNTLETEYKRLYDELESEGGAEEAAEQPDFPG